VPKSDLVSLMLVDPEILAGRSFPVLVLDRIIDDF
jgi:hypothetical protein